MINWLGILGISMILVVAFVLGYIVPCWLYSPKNRPNKNRIIEGYQPQKDCGFLTCNFKPPKACKMNSKGELSKYEKMGLTLYACLIMSVILAVSIISIVLKMKLNNGTLIFPNL